VNKAHDAGQVFDVIIAPYSEVLGADARFRQHGAGFREHQGSAAHCSTREVDEVPVVGKAIAAGVLTHRRNNDSVRQHKVADGERIEKTSHLSCLPQKVLY
jgi:hypothetical protein